ncbi:hypothetical protein D3C73_1494000 [compost metagenome]
MLRGHHRAAHGDGLLNDLQHIDDTTIQAQLAGADAGDVEQIVHQPRHVLHLAFDQGLHSG